MMTTTFEVERPTTKRVPSIADSGVCQLCDAEIKPRASRMIFDDYSLLCGDCTRSVDKEAEGLKRFVHNKGHSLIIQRRKQHENLLLIDPGVFE